MARLMASSALPFRRRPRRRRQPDRVPARRPALLRPSVVRPRRHFHPASEAACLLGRAVHQRGLAPVRSTR